MRSEETKNALWTGRPSPADPGGTFQSIQALRGVAAVLVTVFHSSLRLDTTDTGFRSGNAGVDIFFIISGFVIWTVTARRPLGPVSFLRLRFIRLVPLYWLCTCILVAGWALAPAAFPHMHPTIDHFLLSLAFIPHMSTDVPLVVPVLGQGWTLNFEVFFYVLFAMTLPLPSRLRLVAIGAALVALAVVGVFIPAGLPITTLLSPLLVEFFLGIVIAQAVILGLRPGRWWCWGCMAIGIALLIVASPAAGDQWARLLQYGGPSFLLVGGAAGAELDGSLRIGWLPRWIGDTSYSIYLTHGFAISIVGKLWPVAAPAWMFPGVATLSAIVLGSFVYVLLERPMLTLMRGRRRQVSQGPLQPQSGRAQQILARAITAVSGR